MVFGFAIDLAGWPSFKYDLFSFKVVVMNPFFFTSRKPIQKIRVFVAFKHKFWHANSSANLSWLKCLLTFWNDCLSDCHKFYELFFCNNFLWVILPAALFQTFFSRLRRSSSSKPNSPLLPRAKYLWHVRSAVCYKLRPKYDGFDYVRCL